MNRKQKQELKYFLRKEIARLEDAESQSSEIPFGMDINDARMRCTGNSGHYHLFFF